MKTFIAIIGGIIKEIQAYSKEEAIQKIMAMGYKDFQIQEG